MPQKESSDLHFHLKHISSAPLRLNIILKSLDTAFLHEIREQFNGISEIPSIFRRNDDVASLEFDPAHFSGIDALTIFKHSIESADQIFYSDPKFSDGSVGLLSLISILALVRKRINYV